MCLISRLDWGPSRCGILRVVDVRDADVCGRRLALEDDQALGSLILPSPKFDRSRADRSVFFEYAQSQEFSANNLEIKFLYWTLPTKRVVPDIQSLTY